MLPKRFFVTSGKALSSISKLNAFDQALLNAGIAQCNLVPVSSIIPKGSVKIDYCNIETGAITFVVMAHIEGDSGELLGAGVAWGFIEGSDYGLVAEAHGNMDEDQLRISLQSRLNEMSRVRNATLRDVGYKIEVLRVPEGLYGSAVAALVFIPEYIYI
ncbi:MAG: pyruvoyl-dependent arginine decarboxylase [Nitrososphaerota archaeon]|nr:pyruvoyl-dependent arginine decarboxylase [Candidatus Bathyarchaeota archaeon]MDW8062347.1 pyruvoyl-dependent arginine decarboxylase [Nitrososphaerota archaeon]